MSEPIKRERHRHSARWHRYNGHVRVGRHIQRRDCIIIDTIIRCASDRQKHIERIIRWTRASNREICAVGRGRLADCSTDQLSRSGVLAVSGCGSVASFRTGLEASSGAVDRLLCGVSTTNFDFHLPPNCADTVQCYWLDSFDYRTS